MHHTPTQGAGEVKQNERGTTLNNPVVLGPVLFLFVGAIIALLFARDNRAQRYIALGAGLLMWASSILLLWLNVTEGPQVYDIGGWRAPFGIIFTADMLSSLFGLMTSTVLLGGILYAVGSQDEAVTYPVFMPLLLTMGTGLTGVLYTGDLFNMFVFLELMVISSVSLVAISDNKLGLEAAIKYLFISGIGTVALLISIAAMYASFGTLNLADMANALATGSRPLLAEASAVMLMTAFLVKSAVFPFHFWQPDFHTTAPTPVSALLSSVVVKVGVYGLIRMITLLFTEEAALIQTLLLVLGTIGIFFGGLGALKTYDVKRMLAYSTFGQIGFILIGIGWGTPLALTAAIVYAVNHAFIKAAMLMLGGVVSSHTVSHSAAFADIRGAGYKMKFTGLVFMLGGMALAGVPPMNGFISKLFLIQAGIDAGQFIVIGLVIAAGLITLLYVIRSWQWIFQQKPGPDVKTHHHGDSALAPALLVTLSLALGLFSGPLIDVAGQTVAQISSPQVYISSVLGN